MKEYVQLHFPLFLCIALLIARVGDVLSTYLVTPTLKLEGNPLARKFRWPFAFLSILVCLIPYYNTAIAIPILVASLMVSASNCSKIWLHRTLGESQVYELLKSCAVKAPVFSSLFFILSPCFFLALLGGTVLFFYPDPTSDWGFFIAIGIFAYAAALALYGPLFFFRLRKAVKNTGSARESSAQSE
jgi:hypothetical protein